MKLVLSISGGGIRGIIPAMILADIEKRTSKPISKSFDLIAGTSTGGIIAALLSTPDSRGRPKYSAKNIVEMYENFGKQVFKQSSIRKVMTLDGLIATKYSSKPLESLLQSYFSKTRLSNSITNLLIPTYQISNRPYPYFFKTLKAKKSKSRTENPFLWECARATSAANSYFKPYKMDNKHIFLDGGLFANNPSMCAYSQAKSTYGNQETIAIISIGTGENLIGYDYEQIKNWGILQWGIPFFRQTSISSSETIDYMLRTLTTNGDKYFYIQSKLDEASLKMDNISEKNISNLKIAAKQTLKNNSALINNIVSLIK